MLIYNKKEKEKEREATNPIFLFSRKTANFGKNEVFSN